MKKALFIILLSYFSIQIIVAQDTLTYTFNFPNAIHHEAEISLRIEGIQSSEITAIMSNSSPGRYSSHNFAKNLYNLNAYDDASIMAAIKKTDANVWQISSSSTSINISYTLYANYANGTYSGIDGEFAVLNMPSSLLWIKGLENLPVKVIFNLPDTSSWKIATQLILLDSTMHMYVAPDMDYLMDSPVMLSNFTIKDLDPAENDGYKIRMAINTDAESDIVEKFGEITQKVIHEQKAIFGSLPAFDDSSYTFLCNYGPGFYNDGMEHRNSTMITENLPLNDNVGQLIGSVSHEFFHIWNIERIRPAALEPFDFTKPNMSGELWFGEGFTNYYGELALCRSELIDKNKYINYLSSNINYLINIPGWKYGSPVYMSEMAIYADRASSIDDNNFSNTFVSYYNYGEMIALALDLSLRTEFKDISLDDLMMAMWVKYGMDEISFTNADILNTLAEVSGDNNFAEEFFEAHIYGNELPDFSDLFDKLGYKLIKKNPGKPSIGYVQLKFDGDKAILLSQPLIESAFYEAGLNKGDVILSIDDQAVTSYPELNFIIGTRKIGDEIDVSYAHQGKQKHGIFKLKEDTQIVLIPKETFSIKVSEEEEKLRSDWLSSKVSQD